WCGRASPRASPPAGEDARHPAGPRHDLVGSDIAQGEVVHEATAVATFHQYGHSGFRPVTRWTRPTRRAVRSILSATFLENHGSCASWRPTLPDRDRHP